MTTEPTRTEAETEPAAAIVGVGNRILSDDGVGPHVIDALEAARGIPRREVRLYDAGTTGFFALEAMSGCERAIVVDAIRVGEEPGTVHEYQFSDGGFDDEVPEVTMHDVSFTEALTFARDVYELPDDVRIVGVEPASLRTGLELSEPVRAAIPDVIEAIARYEPTIDADRLEVDPEELGGTLDPAAGDPSRSNEVTGPAVGDGPDNGDGPIRPEDERRMTGDREVRDT